MITNPCRSRGDSFFPKSRSQNPDLAVLSGGEALAFRRRGVHRMKSVMRVWLMAAALAATLTVSAGPAQAQCRGGRGGGAQMNSLGASMLQTPFLGNQMSAFGSPSA